MLTLFSVGTLKLLARGLVLLPDKRDFPAIGGVALVAKVILVSLELTIGRGNVGTLCSRSTCDWLVVGMSSVTCSP